MQVICTSMGVFFGEESLPVSVILLLGLTIDLLFALSISETV